MDRKTKKYFKDLLTTMKQEKEAILKDYQENLNENHGSENSSYPFHSADLGSDAAMLENLSINVSNLLNELRFIDEALTKIDDGTYGVCELCSDPIPKKRLKAVPYAKLCLNCKDKIQG